MVRIEREKVIQKRVKLTAPGFKLIPPESNVIPLPTKARGWAEASDAPL